LISIDYSLNAEEVLSSFAKKKLSIIGDMKEFHAKAASIMLASVVRNFEEGGRPKWRSLKYENRLPLTTPRSYLKKSISMRATDNMAVVFTNVPYAPIHQFGADKKIQIRPLHKTFKFIGKEGLAVFRRIIQAHRIPQRKFLKIFPEDIKTIIKEFKKRIKK